MKTVMDGPLNEVQVPVRSPTGEITYQTFIAAPPLTSGPNQGSPDTRPAVKVDGVSDICPSPRPINIGIPVTTAPNTNNHQHDDHDHGQKSFGVEKAIDGKPNTERREDVDVVGRSFSEADGATLDDCVFLHPIL